MERWPHQQFVLSELPRLIAAGEKRICITSPTGGGKTLMQCDELETAAENRQTAALYTNRKLLTEQTIKRLTERGISFGVRAAGFDDLLNLDAPIQICGLQTEMARVFGSQKWMLHRSDRVVIDEAHLQKSESMLRVIALHEQHNAVITGYTATPVGVNHIYSKLVIAGTTSQLRSCGALVPCMVHAPSEIDSTGLKPQASGEFSLGELKKRINVPVIFGQVYEHWKRLNPDARPAILFAPGVPESLWFAKLFEEKGIVAAHIDGDDVYVDGETHGSNRDVREQVIASFRSGEIKVLCNRFVLREGIDIPECYHGILATPIGSVTSYVQIVGRILRKHPTTPEVILQDHGGNFWRHGSPNADRDWESVWGLSDYHIGQQRIEKMREKTEPDPIVCPQCGAVRMKGAECYRCGHRHDKSVRMVIQKNGSLKAMVGDIFKPRKTSNMPDSHKKWEQMFWRMRKSGRTFKQAEGFFYHEHGYWPEHNLPLMPTDQLDWNRRVEDVPFDRLIQKADKVEQQERMFA